MSADPVHPPAPAEGCKPPSPGRPKDLAKRAAILDVAKRMFSEHGFERVSMDQIAAEAGVSKLTVYSHFGDKEALFVAAVRMYCERQLPASLFESAPQKPLRDKLLDIAQAFFEMVGTPEAVSGHRVMCTPQLSGSSLPALFWEAGPQRIQNDFARLLERRVASGELDVPDVHLASAQFFALMKGELHARLVFGFESVTRDAIETHLEESVDMFLRAYGATADRRRGAGQESR